MHRTIPALLFIVAGCAEVAETSLTAWPWLVGSQTEAGDQLVEFLPDGTFVATLPAACATDAGAPVTEPGTPPHSLLFCETEGSWTLIDDVLAVDNGWLLDEARRLHPIPFHPAALDWQDGWTVDRLYQQTGLTLDRL